MDNPQPGIEAAIDAKRLLTTSPMLAIPPQRPVANAVFEPLFRIDGSGLLHGHLVEHHEWDPDQRTVTLYLRRHVLFHNGNEMTASDVKYSLERALIDGAEPFDAGFIDQVAGCTSRGAHSRNCGGIVVEGRYCLTITLVERDDSFLYRLASPRRGIVPASAMEENGADWRDGFPVGTGPYKIHKTQEQLLLRQWEHYWDPTPDAITEFQVVRPGHNRSVLSYDGPTGEGEHWTAVDTGSGVVLILRQYVLHGNGNPALRSLIGHLSIQARPDLAADLQPAGALPTNTFTAPYALWSLRHTPPRFTGSESRPESHIDDPVFVLRHRSFPATAPWRKAETWLFSVLEHAGLNPTFFDVDGLGREVPSRSRAHFVTVIPLGFDGPSLAPLKAVFSDETLHYRTDVPPVVELRSLASDVAGSPSRTNLADEIHRLESIVAEQSYATPLCYLPQRFFVRRPATYDPEFQARFGGWIRPDGLRLGETDDSTD